MSMSNTGINLDTDTENDTDTNSDIVLQPENKWNKTLCNVLFRKIIFRWVTFGE